MSSIAAYKLYEYRWWQWHQSGDSVCEDDNGDYNYEKSIANFFNANQSLHNELAIT